jgi:hypothetical protein
MTREEFIEVLDSKDYSYEMKGDRIVVTQEGGIGFFDEGSVDLQSLTSLPPGVEFRNEGSVWLRALTSLPPGVEFKNGRDVGLYSLVGGWFSDWKGNIEGIDPKRLLNHMINKGVFER